MLRIHTITSAAAAKSYYTQASDYYSEGSELVGEWGGKLAQMMGLSGTVDRESFERLVDGLHPQTGNELKPRRKDDQRVGIDCVWSGPKSYSVLEAMTGDEDLRRVFREAKRETQEEMQEDVATRVRKAGADEDRTTGNMLWADYEHSTARAVKGQVPDMHRHTHSVCMNLTYDPVERRLKAAQFGDLKRDAPYWEAVFEARLAHKLEGLGYAIDRQGDKAWEIAGVPQSVLDKFSKRTDEIETEAERLGITDADRKGELGARTRHAKGKGLTPQQLRQEWDRQLTDPERQALGAVHRREIARGPGVAASDAVAYAIRHCFERESVVPERELKRVALLHGLGSLTPEQVAAELPRQGVIVREKEGRMMATTKTVLAEERFITGFALTGRATMKAAGVPEGLGRGVLDDDQWRAVRGLLGSHDRINLVDSAAGTGKSTMLKAYDDGMRRAGGKVTYLATTTQAVDVLRRDGFEAETVAKFLVSDKMQEAARGGRVVVDEASMMGHGDAFRLFQAAKACDLRLDFLGDSSQHGSVARGALMRVLREYGGIEPFRLAQIKRQEAAPYKAAVKLLSQGRTLEGFDRLDALGWVKEMPEGDRDQAIASDYLDALKTCKKWDEVLVVSPTHVEGERITERIRLVLRAEGKLAREEREFSRLVPANLTEAQRGDVRNLRPGEVDVLQFHQNGKGYKTGQRIALGDADVSALPLDQAAKFQAYRAGSLKLAEGDVLRFTSGGKTADGKHQIRNGSAYKVAGFTEEGDIRLENGWNVAKDYGHFRHGYVETSFGAQGKTVRRVLIGQGTESFPASNMEQLYVSASRAKEKLTLYTDDKGALRGAIKRSSAKLVATDLVKNAERRSRLNLLVARAQKMSTLARTRAGFATDPKNRREQERQTMR